MPLIEFAPLNVPLERRLQTLAAMHFVFFFLIAPPLSIVFAIYLMFTSFWWIDVLYGIWLFFDWERPNLGSRPQKWFQRSKIWKYFAEYFPQELIKTAELPPDRNYIIGAHPHGIMSVGAFTTFCTNGTGFWEKFPGLTAYLATLPGQFWFPFRREYILISGVINCNRQSLTYMLQNRKGLAIGIVLGGAEEALDSHSDTYDVLLLKRKGFVKLALKTGSSLVPSFNFGENDTYNQVSNKRGTFLRTCQVAFRRYAGFSTPIIFGRGIFNYTFGILPFRTPIHTVVGSPIDVELTPNPTTDDIDKLHAKYCAELKKLFNDYKGKFGIRSDAELNFH